MVTPELLEFLRAQLATGMSRDEVERLLVDEGGWNKDDVEEGLTAIGHPAQEIPKTTTQEVAKPLQPVALEKVEQKVSESIVFNPPAIQTVLAEEQLEQKPAQSEPKSIQSEPVPTLLTVRSERPIHEPEDFLGIFVNPRQAPVAANPQPEIVVAPQVSIDSVTHSDAPILNVDASLSSDVKQKSEVNLVEMLSSVSAPAKETSVSATQVNTPPISPKPPLFVFDLEQAKQPSSVIMATPENPTGKISQVTTPQVITPNPEPVKPLAEKKIETRSVAELWLTQGKVTPQPERDEGKEQAIRSSIQSRRTMASDVLLRGRGPAIQGLPAILAKEDPNPMPQFSSSPAVVSIQTSEKTPEKKPELSPTEALARKNKVKKTLGIVLGILFVLLLLVGGLVYMLSMRGPDPAILLSSVMEKFYATPSLSYNGSASSNLNLTSTVDGATRSGSAKFSITYSGDLLNDKNGFGNGNHNVKWNGGLQTGEFSWSTDVTSDMRMYNGNLFFHVLSFPPQVDIDPDIFKTYWVKVDITEIAKELALNGVEAASQNYGGIAGGQSSTFNGLLAKNMPFTGGTKVGEENINGVPVTHMRLNTDPEKLYALAGDLYGKYLGKTFAMNDEEKVRFKQALAKLTFDVWVNEKTATLIQVSVAGELDDDVVGIHVKGPIALSFTFTSFGDPIVVTEPAPFLTLDELHTRMNDFKKFKEVRAQNNSLISGAGELEHALLAYKNQKGKFPVVLTELRTDNILATSTLNEGDLKKYFYASYIRPDVYTKANKCTVKSSACNAYHLGVNLDEMNNPALETDADVVSDVHGGDSTGCAIEREKACFDIIFPLPGTATTTASWN